MGKTPLSGKDFAFAVKISHRPRAIRPGYMPQNMR